MPYTPDWSELLKGGVAAVTAIVAVYNWQSGRRRAKLRDDLDILKRYREEMAVAAPPELMDDCRYASLRAKVQRKMEKTYVLRGTDRSELIIGLGFAFVALVVFFFPNDLPFGLRVPKEWSFSLVIVAALGALYYVVAARKGRHDWREQVDAGSRSAMPERSRVADRGLVREGRDPSPGGSG